MQRVSLTKALQHARRQQGRPIRREAVARMEIQPGVETLILGYSCTYRDIKRFTVREYRVEVFTPSGSHGGFIVTEG